MKKGRYYTEDEITVLSQSVIGKTFREIKDKEVLTVKTTKITKGGLGAIIEQDLFGIEANQESAPDFIDAGIELKVTPYKRNKDNTLSAKERLVLNMIDYNTEYKNQFDSSHFWYKNNKIQILWYLHEDGKEKLDFKITHEKLLELALSEDLEQIKEDWNTIVNKIKDGKAHEISEGDTMYLGACTKGVNSNDTTSQPFNTIPAKRRAFCFKNSYMTQLVRKNIGDYSNVEKILEGTKKTFMEFINDTIKNYIGMSQTELKKLFEIDSTAKNLNTIIINRMFNLKGNLSDTEEFLKSNIQPRTVRIEKNGRIKESFPFPSFKYTDLVNEDWETSEFRDKIENTKYLFFIFENNGEDYIFKGVKLWNMPETDIEEYVKEVWLKTKDVILSGNIVNRIDDNGYRITNFPGMKENKVCHVRPHAINMNDTFPLPVKIKLLDLRNILNIAFG